MKIFAPSPPLAPFVRVFMVVEVRDETTRVRLPELGLVMGVRYRGHASVLAGDAATRLPDASLAGMTGTARQMRTAGGSGIVLAQFHPAGAAPFFDAPLHELFGSSVALDELASHSDVDQVRSRVTEAPDDAARVAAVEAFLLARLGRRAPDPIVTAAVQLLTDARGRVPIRALASRLGISQDPLEKRFRRAVGASPKQLASLLRLRHAIESYRPGVPLSRLAVEAGYFDQSHFSRELRAVTGEAPGSFLRAGTYRWTRSRSD